MFKHEKQLLKASGGIGRTRYAAMLQKVGGAHGKLKAPCSTRRELQDQTRGSRPFSISRREASHEMRGDARQLKQRKVGAAATTSGNIQASSDGPRTEPHKHGYP